MSESEDENGNEVNDGKEVRKTRNGRVGEKEGDSSISSDEHSENKGRLREPLVWMHDYVSGEGLSGNEANMVQVEPTNPLCFEEALKNAKWKLAMDCEIKSIERKKTWILT